MGSIDFKTTDFDAVKRSLSSENDKWCLEDSSKFLPHRLNMGYRSFISFKSLSSSFQFHFTSMSFSTPFSQFPLARLHRRKYAS